MTAPAPTPRPWQTLPKRVLIADGLLVVAHLVWPHGPLTRLWSIPIVLAGLGLVAAVQLRPALLSRLPWPPVRAHPLTFGLLLLLSAGVIGAEPALGTVLHLAGTFLLWRETRSPEVSAHVDPALAWRSGWASRVILGAFLLCLMALAAEWTGAFSTSYYSYVGDYSYYNTYSNAASNGWETGKAPFLALLLVGAALWLVSPPVRNHRLGRWLPLVAFAGAGIQAAIVAWEDWRYVEELHDIGGGYPQMQAGGPVFFVIFAIAGAVAALVQVRRGRLAAVRPLPGSSHGEAGDPPVAPT